MPQTSLRYRQIHLDFHTSADCKGVATHFDAQRFASILQESAINSITIFAKCHHGYSYYPTSVGTVHPELQRDLLGEQIEALHAAGIRAPIYVTVMWDELAGTQHPEWVIVSREGKSAIRKPLSPGWGWATLDVTSGYGDYLFQQVEELCQRYPVDGFFLDITAPLPNYSLWNVARMQAAGIDPENDAEVQEWTIQQYHQFYARLSSMVQRYTPEATLFYNGSVSPLVGRTLAYQTHVEIESLPTTTQWGYFHYPMNVRHVRTYGVDFLGMTGRFHKSWADFGGLKTRDQLAYECGTILASGGKISIGDQLHPLGELDPAVYRLIGDTFRYVERLEPWLDGAKTVADVALLAPVQPVRGSYDSATKGAAQMLMEGAVQFDILSSEQHALFQRYTTIILPETITVDALLRSHLEAFLAAGGKLVVSGTATLDAATNTFGLQAIPATYVAPLATVPSYLRPDAALVGESELAADYDYVCYEQAHQVAPAPGATIYGEIKPALFTRSWLHFTSHEHAPVAEGIGAPLMVANDQVLYSAAPLFSVYSQHDYWAYRAIFLNALQSFMSTPARVRFNGPGWVEVTLQEQPAGQSHGKRHIVHLVAYHPRRTNQQVPHVDQGALTAGLSIRVSVGAARIKRVYFAPEEKALAYRQDGNEVLIDLPPIGVHSVVVIEEAH